MPPIAGGIAEPPLKDKGRLTVGYRNSGWPPHTFFLQKGQKVDVWILKLFVSRKAVNLSHVAQSSPFAPIERRSTAPSSSFIPIEGHSTTPSSSLVASRGFDYNYLLLPWDTVEIPLVLRRAK